MMSVLFAIGNTPIAKLANIHGNRCSVHCCVMEARLFHLPEVTLLSLAHGETYATRS